MRIENQNEARVKQTSFYLVRRTEAILGALKFFADQEAGESRLLQFLAQSEFWEWELDNLIYSFTNLAERQASWRSSSAAQNKLNGLGIVVDARTVKRAYWRGGRWHHRVQSDRVAPVEMLAEVIQKWNELVDHAEQKFIAPMRKQADRWNIQTRTDLNSLRRSMPQSLVNREIDPEESEEQINKDEC